MLSSSKSGHCLKPLNPLNFTKILGEEKKFKVEEGEDRGGGATLYRGVLGQVEL